MSSRRNGSKRASRIKRLTRQSVRRFNARHVLHNLSAQLEELADAGQLVLADPSEQVPNNSESAAPTYYVDTPFTCVDCGDDDVWTAGEQKWYYEVVKGSLYAGASRCLTCRRQRRSAKQRQRRRMQAGNIDGS